MLAQANAQLSCLDLYCVDAIHYVQSDELKLRAKSFTFDQNELCFSSQLL